MQNLRAQSPNLDKNELRMSRYGIHELFMQQTGAPGGIVSADLEERAFASIGRTLEVPVFDYDGTVSVTNTRTLTIPDSENTSRMLQITFSTISWGFTMTPAMYINNEVGEQQDFNRKMLKYIYLVAATMDNAGGAAMEAAKTQVLNDDLGGQFSLTANTLRVPLAKAKTVVGSVDSLFEGNDHYDPITVVGNPSFKDNIINQQLLPNQTFNATDQGYQWMNKAFTFSNRVANAADTLATFFAVSGSQLGLVTRVERESLLGRRMADGTEWGITRLPVLGFRCGTFFYESKGDYSGIAGTATADMTRAYKEHYGFSFDYAHITPHNSDRATIPSPIFKVEVATT